MVIKIEENVFLYNYIDKTYQNLIEFMDMSEDNQVNLIEIVININVVVVVQNITK